MVLCLIFGMYSSTTENAVKGFVVTLLVDTATAAALHSCSFTHHETKILAAVPGILVICCRNKNIG